MESASNSGANPENDSKKGQPPPLTDAEKKDKVKLGKIAPILMACALIFIGLFGWLCLDARINLAGRTESVSTFGEKLEFTAKYQILGVTWLVFCMFLVVFQRSKTGALNPLHADREIYLATSRNVFQNSLEQFVISMFAQICLISFISGKFVLRTIPLVNFLFFISRITFWLGYPMYRTFGVVTSLIPSFAMIVFSLYKFFEHLFA